MKTIIGEKKLHAYKMKKGEMIVFVHGPESYELGVGKVIYLPKDAKSRHDTDAMSFMLAGYKTVYDYDNRNSPDANKFNKPREAEINTAGYHMNLAEAMAFSKMMSVAVDYVKNHKVTVEDVQVRREYERILELKKAEHERLENSAIARRELIWTEHEDGSFTESNGLFSIVPNVNPEYRQKNKKYVLRGPQYDRRFSSIRTKDGGVEFWKAYTCDIAIKTVEGAKKEAKSLLEYLLKDSPNYNEGEIRLLKEVGNTGRVVATETLKRRQRIAPLAYRPQVKS